MTVPVYRHPWSGRRSLRIFILFSGFFWCLMVLYGSFGMRGAYVRLELEKDSSKCEDSLLLLSTSRLESKKAFPSTKNDPVCSDYEVRHFIPGCYGPSALASYPGSGNTWLRYLLENSVGVFTGSRYKDLEIQSSGMWGEIRPWNEGSTLVQKTHDASKDHVLKDFRGGERGILLLRNPYEAILSVYNFLYGGHVGLKSDLRFSSHEWSQFLASQTEKWLDMATNWTVYSDPSKLTVVHLENLVEYPEETLVKIITDAFRIQPDPRRIKCALKYKMGHFRRNHGVLPEIVPFKASERLHIDRIIDYVDDILIRKGYEPLPLDKYEYYRKTDEEILDSIRRKNSKRNESSGPSSSQLEAEEEDTKGLQMVLDSYIKLIDKNGKLFEGKTPFSQSALKFVKKAIKLWPDIRKNIVSKDPLQEEIDKESERSKSLDDIPLPRL